MSCSRALLVFVITLSASPSGAQVQPRTAPPDTILVNGRVFTGSETHPYAEALAIKGTRILAIGTSEEISSKAGPTTRRIDLAGRLVIPGINDSHTHFEADVMERSLISETIHRARMCSISSSMPSRVHRREHC